jgi:TPR repeat protein
VPEDRVEAARWLKKAAERGHYPAQCNLARMYRAGNGVPRDDTEAAKWFRRAAEQGDSDARFCLADMYAHGIGVSQSLVEAYAWLSLTDSPEARQLKRALMQDMTTEQLDKGAELGKAYSELYPTHAEDHQVRGVDSGAALDR